MADNERHIKQRMNSELDRINNELGNNKIKNKKEIDAEKEFKIQYQVNMLPSMNEQDGSNIIQAISNSEDLEIFTCSVVQDLINYKWQTFASKVHWFGWMIHIVYIISLQLYIIQVYLVDNHSEAKVDVTPVWLYVIGLCLIYPIFYDGRQMIKSGWRYLDDKWNFIDIFHISMGLVNLLCQKYFNPFNLTCKVVIIIVIITCLIKQFFFMRVVESFTYIVTMILSVIIDLQVFLTFYFILMISFSMVFNVIAINKSPEYEKVGSIMGNFITVMRLSLGDFSFDLLEDLNN